MFFTSILPFLLINFAFLRYELTLILPNWVVILKSSFALFIVTFPCSLSRTATLFNVPTLIFPYVVIIPVFPVISFIFTSQFSVTIVFSAPTEVFKFSILKNPFSLINLNPLIDVLIILASNFTPFPVTSIPA